MGHRIYYTFGPFRLEPEERRLLRDGVRVELRPKAFDLLVVFLKSGGRLLSHEGLKSAVWPESQTVSPVLLAVTLTDLKKALGERSGREEYIENQRGAGYRFKPAVRLSEEEDVARPEIEKRALTTQAGYREGKIEQQLPPVGGAAVLPGDTGAPRTAESKLQHAPAAVARGASPALTRYGWNTALWIGLAACIVSLLGYIWWPRVQPQVIGLHPAYERRSKEVLLAAFAYGWSTSLLLGNARGSSGSGIGAC